MTSRDETDLYAVLGVDPHARSEQGHPRLPHQLRRHYPDTRPTAPEQGDADGADTHRQLVLAAYAVLRDPARRAHYDRRRLPAPRQPPRPAHPNAADPPVVIGTLTHSRSSRPALIATSAGMRSDRG